VHVARPVGKEPHAGKPSERERRDHAEQRHEERRRTHLHHLGHRRVEAHLEEEEDHAEAGQDRKRGVRLERLEAVESGEAEVADHDARDELSQNRRLADVGCDPAADLGRHEDHREGEKERDDGVSVLRRVRPRGGDHAGRERDQERLDAAGGEHRGSIPKGRGFW
jgi:hypothetical protein